VAAGTEVGGSAVGSGGNGSDWGTGIAVDASDNAWVVGMTNSNNFPITADAYSLYCEPAEIASGAYIISVKGNSCGGPNASGYYYSGSYSVFLVKLNPDRERACCTAPFWAARTVRLMRRSLSMGRATFMSRDRPTPTSPGRSRRPVITTIQPRHPRIKPQALAGGEYSAFVTKFAPDGKSLLYSTMFGGPYQSTVSNALAVGAGKIFIGGYTRDPHLPTTPGALSSTCPGGPTAAGPDTICVNGAFNGYVAEFDATRSGAASLVFSTYLNGSVSTQGPNLQR